MTDRIDYFGTGKDAGEYSFLSNFYLVDEGLYAGMTVEHWFQAGKTQDEAWRNRILDAESPGVAKKLGRRAPLRSDWEEVKLPLMLKCLRTKFTTGTKLAQRLLDTGDAELIEGNWWGDAFWGVDQKTGKGENHLGRLLMQVREELRHG